MLTVFKKGGYQLFTEMYIALTPSWLVRYKCLFHRCVEGMISTWFHLSEICQTVKEYIESVRYPTWILLDGADIVQNRRKFLKNMRVKK